MLRSMTAFARVDMRTDYAEVSWEIRSVNHRYLETFIRVSDDLRFMEGDIRTAAAAKLDRGKLECSFSFKPIAENSEQFVINEALARNVSHLCHDVSALLSNPGRVSPLDMLKWPGILETKSIDPERLKADALIGLDKALDELVQTRVREGEKLADALNERLAHIKAGVDEVRERLRFVQNETSAYIKFAPDYFVVDNSNPENLYLLEFKCTRTPLYSPRRINMLRLRASDSTLEAEAIGQMEQAPYENYLRLSQMNIRVAILNYCAYASQKFLCEFVEKIRVIHHDVVRLPTLRGSRTPFINFDLRSMWSLTNFLSEEHPRISREIIGTRVASTLGRLEETLPVIHANE